MAASDSESAQGPRSPGARPPRVSLPVLIGGLVLAYFPQWGPSLGRLVGIDLSGWGPAASMIWNWLAVGLLLIYVIRVERLGLDSLRLVRPTEADLEWAGWLSGAAVLWHWVASRWIVPGADPIDGSTETGSAALVALGPLLALALVITVSITEEVLWRGYVVERLGAWIGLIPAAAIGLAIFVVGHLDFFGPTWLITNLPGAVLIYALLLWRRNLFACILAHFVSDIPIVVVSLFT